MISTLLRRCLAVAVALAPAFTHAGLVHAVNSGGGAASPFAADAYFTGGSTYSSASAINTSGVTDPAPQAVYQTERYGNFTYTFTGLGPGAAHTVRLHLAETFHSTAGSRRFHVSINGTQVLTDYDIFAEAGGRNIAIVEEFPATANPSGQIVVQFANGAADNAKSSGIEILDNVAAGSAPTRIQVDFGNGAAYSGTAAAPGTGTVWNNFTAQTTASHTLSNVSDASGVATACDVTVASSSAPMKSWSQTSLGTPNPSGLMSDYFYGNTYTVTVSELPAGNYYLYVYAHGDQANQTSTVTVSAANGGGGATTGSTGTEYRNVHTAGAQGYSYVRFQPVVGAVGTLTFSAASYLNGFQLISFPTAVFTLQPPPSPSAVIGSDFNLTAAATGDGTLTYQWRKGGLNLADGPTYAGVTTPTLTIANVQAADAGNYDLVVTNPGGSIASNVATLSTTTTPLAPEIVSGPFNQSIQATQAVTFTTVVNGTSPLAFAWTKDGSPVTNGATAHGSVISGADTSTLTIANAKLADAGTYLMTVTNPVGSDSGTATFVVNQSPVILSQPQSATVNSGTAHTLSATFGEAFPTPVYQWSRSADGITFTNVSGGNGPSLELAASAATSGFYRVTATNSAGSVTSSVVYFGIPGTEAATFAPANNAIGISIDQQLRLVFPSPPKLGLAGALRIHDASNNSVVVTIDRSQFTGYTLFGGTIINAATQTVQGKQMFYLPMAIYGNEVWFTLGLNQRLAYGKTYYVTMDAGLLVDSNNAAWPGISGSNAWRFSTKATGPETPTTTTGRRELTVGMDGTGDFATIQGAADWIPQDNTLPRTIRVKPGIYRDIAYFGQNRDFISLVGDGADREDVRLIHLYPAEVYGDGARGMGALRIDTDDVTVRDMTIDNEVYVAQPNLAGGFAPGAPAFAGPINTVATTGKRLVFDNVLLKGGQDTLYTITGIAYFHRCEIWGSVDFIYGDALGVFDDCDIVQIRSTGGPIGAPSTPFAQPYGEVFLNCRFPRALVANGYPYDVGANTTTFMRPWRQDGATAVINCQLGTHITTKGWGEWGDREVTCRAREHGNTIIGGGAAPTPAQRLAAGGYWTNTIDPDYTGPPMTETNSLVSPSTGTGNRQAVTVNPADYTLDAIFGHPYFNLNGWMPVLAPRITSQPVGAAVDSGDPVTLSVAATGTPAPAFQWYRNGTILTGGTNSTLAIPNATASDAGSYTVVVSNSGGSTESVAAMVSVNDPEVAWAASFGLNPATNGAPGEDPDGDGLANRLEFLLGGNPVNGSLAAILPSASRSASAPAALVFRFNIAKAAADVAWSVETSFGLEGTWIPAVHGVAGVTIAQGPLNAAQDQVTVTVPTSEPKIFGRLRVPLP